MFDLAVIAPVYDLELSDELSHLYMVLSWLCKEDPQYKSHFANIKRKHEDAYVVLDNGMNEGKMSSDQEIISIAHEINASEIICPDVYLEAAATVRKTKKFLDEYYETYIKNKLKVMSVLQGKTEDEFNSCFKEFINDNRIHVIGVGYRNLKDPFINAINNWNPDCIDTEYLKKELDEECYYYTLSRLYYLSEVLDFDELKKNDKIIHLLGLWNPFELSLYKKVLPPEKLLYIRGCDSAAPCQAAQAGVVFNKEYGVKNKPKALLEFDKRMDGNVNRLAKHNIEIIKEWVSDEDE